MLFITEISGSGEGAFVAKIDLLEDHVELLVGDAGIAVRRLHTGVSELLLEHVHPNAAEPSHICIRLSQAVRRDAPAASGYAQPVRRLRDHPR